MEEFVRHRVEHVGDHAGRAQRHGRRHHGAIPVFHPVAATPGHVIAEKRVVPGLEVRELAEHGALLPDDLLRAPHVLVDLGVTRVVMDRRSDRDLFLVRAADLEGSDGLVA